MFLCRNEEEVGYAIKKSSVTRDDIYVVTKTAVKGYDECLKAFKGSKKR